MSDRYQHKGRFRISRYTSNVEPYNGIRLIAVDEASRVTFFQAEMTVEALGMVLTGLDVEIEFELLRPELVGSVAENKTETVPGNWHELKQSEEKTREALAPFEVDGWRGRVYDLHNHHNQGKGGVKVAFFRHVNPKTGEPVTA